MTMRRTVAAMATLSSLAIAQADLYDLNTIRDVYLSFSQPNWWAQLTANYGPEINIAANMSVDGITYPNVGVRFRGNTSYTQLPPQPQQGWEKKSFNIELDWQVAGQDIYGYDSLNLNNGFHDPTFLREVLTYYVMRRHGLAPKANWVRLHLNGTYWGIYVNVQQPNKDMMQEWFRSNDGNRYRGFPTTGTFGNGRCAYTVLNPNTPASYLAAYQAKQGDGVDLMNMCTVLGAMTTAVPQSTLTNVFSVDSFYRYAAVMVAMQNTDSYLSSGKDHFCYIDNVHGDGSTFPYDCNEAMAGSSMLATNTQVTNTFRPAFTKTLIFADWLNRYKAHQRAVIDHTLNPTHLTPLIQQWHAVLALPANVPADTKKIYSTTQFTQGLTTTMTVTGVTLLGLLPFVTQRYNFMNTDAYINPARPTLSNLAHTPLQPNPTQPITFTVQASATATGVNLWSRTIGEFVKAPMFDDGLHGDGAAADGVWGVVLPAQTPGSVLDYYAEAIAAGGGARYEPYTAECERYCPKVQIGWPILPSPVVINEFVAQNVNGPVDEAGQHEDWLELYNDSSAPVDVSGKWLSDSLVVLKWQIPAGTTIAPFSVLRIWCDEDLAQGPLHADFKLSTNGESIGFWDAAGTSLHDAYTFDQQSQDVSTGRLADGGGPWVTFVAPSFEARNELTGCGQRTYGARTALVHGAAMAATGTLQVGTTITYHVTTGPANGVGVSALALAGDHVDLAPFGLGSEVLLLAPASLVLPDALLFDASGAANWAFGVPSGAGIAGIRLHAQAFAFGAGTWDGTRAIEVTICP